MAAVALVPELYCSDLERSVAFYVDVLGFAVVYDRPEERFVYLQHDGAELMLEEPTGRTFLAAELEYPYGRGVNLQIEVADVRALYAAVQTAAWPVFLELETRWYRRGDLLLGNRQFVVQDRRLPAALFRGPRLAARMNGAQCWSAQPAILRLAPRTRQASQQQSSRVSSPAIHRMTHARQPTAAEGRWAHLLAADQRATCSTNSSTRLLKARGLSMFDRWPASGMIT